MVCLLLALLLFAAPAHATSTYSAAVDATVGGTEDYFTGASPTIVEADSGVIYAFYVDSGNECHWAKSTNTGSSWTDLGAIDSVNASDCVHIYVWYDKWTPGISSTDIHVITIDSGSDNFFYTKVNTAAETKTTTYDVGAVATGVTSLNAVPSITRSADGYLYVGVNQASAGATFKRCKITDDCTTGTAATKWPDVTSPFSAAGNFPLQLIALPTDEIVAVYHDKTNDYITAVKGTSSVSGISWATAKVVASSVTNSSGYQGMLSAVYNPNDGLVYIAYGIIGSAIGTNDYIGSAMYSPSTNSTTARTDIVASGASQGIHDVALAFDAIGNTLIAVYAERTSSASATSVQIYEKYSTDNGQTWSAAKDIYTTQANHQAVATSYQVIDNMYVGWLDATNSDYRSYMEARGYYNATYRFFANANSTTPGSALAAANTASYVPALGTPVRLRQLLVVTERQLYQGKKTYKLQYAEKSGSCDTGYSGETYADVGAPGSGAAVAFYNNASPADGASINSALTADDPTYLSRTNVGQTYEEQNNFTSLQLTQPADQNSMWDSALVLNTNSASGAYCFRMYDATAGGAISAGVLPELLNPISITSVDVASNGTYKTGDVISIRVNFSANVLINQLGGYPTLALNSGGTATWVTGHGSSVHTFEYTVGSGQTSSDLDYSSTSALALNGGQLNDSNGNAVGLTLPTPGASGSLGASNNVVVDGTAPTVSSITSSTTNGTYKAGQSVSIQVQFSEVVNVTGTPALTLETGASDAAVDYVSGTGTDTLTFTYTISSGHTSSDLDYVATNSLANSSLGTIQDAAGNNATLTLPSPGATNSLGANKALVVDTTAPTVSGVTSSTTNGNYRAGQAVSIQVNFSEAVTVSGTPRLTLETGTSDAVVNYASGSGTSTLTFTYTISSGDTSSDLDYVATNSLAFNGGTIDDAGGNSATLTLASPGATNSLGANKALVIDTTAPNAPSISSPSDGSNTSDTTPDISGTAEANSTVTVYDGGATLGSVSADGSGNWTYTSSALSEASHALTAKATDAAGNQSSASSTVNLTISTATVTVSDVSSSSSNGKYGVGQSVSIQVQFSGNVTVTGTPRLTLETGASDAVVNYASGSGTDTLTFTYTVSSGHTSSDLDYVGTSSLALNGGTIKGAGSVDATLTLPSPGAAGSLGANKSIMIDGTAPTVDHVTSNAGDGFKKAGDAFLIDVHFTETVYVTGTPRITLETGASDAVLDYNGGSGTTVLSFYYEVQSGHGSTDLDYQATNSLVLNGGTIADDATNSATLTLAAPGAAGSLSAAKDIIVDTTAPTVDNVTASTANGSYKVGDVISIQVHFTEDVNISGTPRLTLETGSSDAVVDYASGDGSQTLTFTYTIASGQNSSDLDYVATNSLALNGGTIRDAASNNATLTLPAPAASGSLGMNKSLIVDTTAPTVNGVTSSTTNGSYKAGQAISVQVEFSETVTVTGTPQLTLETGTTDAVVDYASGSGTDTLTFTYTISSGHTSADLDYVATTSLALNGGTIRDAALNSATRTLASPGAANSLGNSKALVVDTTAPNAPTISSPSDGAATGDSTPDISGTAEASSTVTVYDGGATLGTTTADGSGNWTYTSSTLSEASHALTAKATDAAGNQGSASSTVNLTVDLTGPAITDVTSSTTNGSYKAGQVISIQIEFSDNVTVTGTPSLTLETGASDAVVNYASGTGTDTLTFTYTIASGHTSSDLDYVATNSLALNGGTIKDGATNNATLTLASPGAAGSLGNNKALVVDTTAPNAPTISSPSDGATTTDTTPDISGTAEANSTVTVYDGGATLGTTTADGSGNWTYTSSALSETSHALTAKATDAAGNQGVASSTVNLSVDSSGPTVTDVTSSTTNGSYKAGQAISVQVEFSEAVTVSGTPRLTLETGASDAVVNYASGSGTDTLTFTYTIGSGHTSADLDYVATNSLALNGGTIKDAATNDATLTLPSPGASGSLGANKALVIDTTAPSAPTISSPSDGATTDDSTPDISGTAEANSTVTVYDGVSTLGTTTADGSGNWTYTSSALSGGAHSLTARATDAAGNQGSASTAVSITVDLTAPTVSGVTSSTTDGSYRAGQAISIQVTFTENVTVTGTPRLTLETGTTDAVVNYASGNGTNVLTFTYTIASGHTSSDLDYASTNALALNGGTIKDGVGNDATLTLASPGATGSLADSSALIVDTTAPNAPSISSPSDGATTGDATPDVSGTAEANSTVTVYDGVSTLGTTTANGGGNWTYTSSSLSDGGHALTAKATDAAGNQGSASAAVNITVDASAPAVTNVTSATANGTFKVGDQINIQVVFDDIVTVTGTPRLTLETGSSDAVVNYASGSGSTTLVFTYTVASGQISSDLDYAATNALALNGGTIRDAGLNDAALTLASPGASGSLGANKALVVDGVVPTVSGVTSNTANGSYSIGHTIGVQVNFTEAVAVTGTPRITLETGTSDAVVDYVSGSGTSTLLFTYTVASGESSSDLDYVATNSLALNAGTIADAAGNNATLTLEAPGAAGSLGANKAIVINTTAPSVTNVTSSATNGTFVAGQSISITIEFTQAVTVTGAPQLALNSGGTATYASGTGTDTLSFSYTVQAGENTSDLDYANGAALTLNGGTIKDNSTNDAVLGLPNPGGAGSLGGNKALVIDTGVPTVSGVTSAKTNGTYGVGETIDITVTFTENVTVTGTPRLTLETGSSDAVVNYASGSGTTILTFTYTVASGQNSSDLDYAGTGALALNGGTIKDAATNNATLTLATPGAANSLGANKALEIDSTAPSAPTISSPITGSTTNDATPDVSGTAEANSTVTVYNGGVSIGSTTASTGGAWTVTPSSGLTEATHTLTAKAEDAAENESAASSSVSLTVDTIAPTVSGVSSSTGNGSFSTGDTISIQVTFTESVTVTGTPQLTLETGSTDAVVNYASGSGSTALTFTYTVGSAQTSSDLDYAGTGALALNSGTIRDSAGNNATLTLATPGAANSLGANKALVIDTTVPTVSNITSSTTNGSYKSGDAISLQVEFSESVTVTGTPRLTLETGTADAVVDYASGTGTNVLTFTYTVDSGQTSSDLDYVSTSALALNGGTIRDGAGNNATLTLAAPGATNSLGANKALVIDSTIPTVSGVSSSTADGSYGAASAISIQVTFSEAVTVTGTPTLALNSAGSASYASGSGTTSLTFTYTVSAAQNAADLDYSATNSLALAGGTIKDGADNSATLTLAAPGAANSLGANKAIVIDTTVPAAPTISAPTNGATTSDSTPDISGTAEASSTVTVYDSGVSIGTATAAVGGAWTFTPSSALSDGSHSITAKATDAANNQGTASSTVTITIDGTAPAAPSITSPSSGSTTSNNRPTISGTAEANASVGLYISGSSIGSGSANGSGAWSIIPASALTDATHSITARATDSAGNQGAASTALSLTVDTAVPAAPVISSPTTGTKTAVRRPAFSGTAEANSTVTVYDSSSNIGTTATSSGGAWTFTPSSDLSEAQHTITVRATDGSGNTSPVSNTALVTIDITAPAAPVIAAPTNASTINQNKPTVSGTAEADSSVQIYEGATSIGSVAADSAGNWSHTLLSALTEGAHSLTAKATDGAGNASVASGAISFTVDSIAAAAPVIVSPVTGASSTNAKPTLTGTAEANLTVLIFSGAVLIDSTTADGSGNWTYTFTSSLTDGTHSLTAKAVDAASNLSAESTAVVITVDANAPAAPTITSPATGSTVNSTQPIVTGTAEANVQVSIFANGDLFGVTTANGSGEWSFTFTTPLDEGTYSLTVSASDGVNTSAASNAVNITVAGGFTIQGYVRLTDVDKSGLAGVAVSDGTRQGVTDENGFFSIENVPEGNYTLEATKNGYKITADERTNPVALSSAGVSDKNFTAKPSLTGPVYLPWNGFIDMVNVAEIINTGSASIEATLTIFDLNGTEGANKLVMTIAAGKAQDIILNNVEGFSKNNYGVAKIEFSKDTYDGRLSYYKLSKDNTNFDFAFTVPFSNALKGTSFVTFNTYQPSGNRAELRNLVPNWLTVVNLDTSAAKDFTINRYDGTGKLVKQDTLSLPPMGRYDTEGGHEFPGPNSYGVNEVIPTDPQAPYLTVLNRYGSNSTGDAEADKFQFAISLLGQDTAGTSQHVPVGNESGSNNYVEIVNTKDEPVAVTVHCYNAKGKLLDDSVITLQPRAQEHFYASGLLPKGAKGTISLEPSLKNAVVAQGIVYYRNKKNAKILAAYGTQSSRPFGKEAFGSYNTHLNITNWIRLINVTDKTVSVRLTVNPSKMSQTKTISLAPRQRVDVDLGLNTTKKGTFKIAKKTYGVLAVQSSEPGAVLSEVLRLRSNKKNEVDFASSTMMR